MSQVLFVSLNVELELGPRKVWLPWSAEVYKQSGEYETLLRAYARASAAVLSTALSTDP